MKDDEIDEKEENVYTPEGRKELVEDDEISTAEEGFMEGAEGEGKDAKCRLCGEILKNPEDVYEIEIDGEVERFCSEKHAKKYMEEHE